MYNKVFLIGNLTRDPELRYTPAGIPVARFTVAVNRPKKDKKDEVDFIPVVAWRRLAEICGEFLKKGRPVAIEGRLQIRSFKTRAGAEATMTEVVADGMQMLGSKPAPSPSGAGPAPAPPAPAAAETKEKDEEIPF